MRNSIFEIENRLDIKLEFSKFIETLSEPKTIYRDYQFISLFDFFDNYIFNLWRYRDTFIDLKSYLEHIGINDSILSGYKEIDEITFLNFLELLENLMLTAERQIGIDNIKFQNLKVKNIIKHNIPIILEKMNYEKYQDGDKICIRKRDADVDSILEIVPADISQLLLSYNDIRNNNIESKKAILKKLDLFIEENKAIYKSLNSSTYDSIQTIVNKMGINHPILEEPYISLNSKTLIEWYDKCFKLILHLIRCDDINRINKERNQLIGKE